MCTSAIEHEARETVYAAHVRTCAKQRADWGTLVTVFAIKCKLDYQEKQMILTTEAL